MHETNTCLTVWSLTHIIAEIAAGKGASYQSLPKPVRLHQLGEAGIGERGTS